MQFEQFEQLLKTLPNNSGFGIYFVESFAGNIMFNPVDKKFYNLVDQNGYQKFSLVFTFPITVQQEDEFFHWVANDLFRITCYSKISRSFTTLFDSCKNPSQLS